MTNDDMAKLAKLLVKWLRWRMFNGIKSQCHFFPICAALIEQCAKYDGPFPTHDASDIPF